MEELMAAAGMGCLVSAPWCMGQTIRDEAIFQDSKSCGASCFLEEMVTNVRFFCMRDIPGNGPVGGSTKSGIWAGAVAGLVPHDPGV